MQRGHWLVTLALAIALTGCASRVESTQPAPPMPSDAANSSEPPAVTEAPSSFSEQECAEAWIYANFSTVAPGFADGVDVAGMKKKVKQCSTLPGPGTTSTQRLYLEMYAKTAQILEREIRRVSEKEGINPCEAAAKVTKAVNGRAQLLFVENVQGGTEGYLKSGFLPVLQHQWSNGPFRLKFDSACKGGYGGAMMFMQSGTLAPNEHPRHWPRDEFANKHPWTFDHPEGRMHVCITWGVKLHNLSSGAKGKIFKFLASDEQFSDVFDCYPRALNPTKFPGDDFAFVKNLR